MARSWPRLCPFHRHFPRREVLLEALLRKRFDELANKAGELNNAPKADEALVSWLHEAVGIAHDYRGAINSMVAAIADPSSALHASCQARKAAGTRLLVRAQDKGLARSDLNGFDLFGLLGALAWLRDQPSLAARADHLFEVISNAMLTKS